MPKVQGDVRDTKQEQGCREVVHVTDASLQILHVPQTWWVWGGAQIVVVGHGGTKWLVTLAGLSKLAVSTGCRGRLGAPHAIRIKVAVNQEMGKFCAGQ